MKRSKAVAHDVPQPGRFRMAWMVAALLLAGIAAYSNSFSVPFLFDDHEVIERNPSVKSVAQSFSPPRDGATVAGRPLVNVTLAINFAVGGEDVRGYHVTNLAIHLAASLTLFGVARRLFARLRNPPPDSGRGFDPQVAAFATALVWSVHPLLTGAVTYVAQRAELLAALFYLLTMYAFVRATDAPTQPRSGTRQAFRSGDAKALAASATGIISDPPRPNTFWSSVAIGACLLGMASKEVMVSAPLMVLLMDRTFIAGTFAAAWRQRRGLYLGLAATWIPLAWFVVGTSGRGGTAGFSAGVPVWDYLLTQCWAIVRYLGLALWPNPLVFDYGTGLRTSLGDVVVQAVLVVGLLAAVVYLVWRRPALGFVGAFFFAVLAPSSSVVPVATQTIAEHRMYLPLAALVTLAVFALHTWLGRRAIWAAAAWAAALGTVTVYRNHDYRTELSIWTDTAAKVPENARALSNVGKALSVLGRDAEAVVYLQDAVRMQPDLAVAHFNLGLIHFEAGDVETALRDYEAAMKYDPNYGEARLNYAVILLMKNRPADALPYLEDAVRVAPGIIEVRIALGNTLAQLGRLKDAAAQHEVALVIDPESAAAHFNYANVLFQMRRPEEAEPHYRKALQDQPGDPDAHFYLGVTLLALGKTADGKNQLEQALALKPDHAQAREVLNQLQGAKPAAPGP